MNEVVPLSNFRRISEIRGASSEDYEDAIREINRLFTDLCLTLDNAIHDTATPILGIAANVKENSEIGSSMRIDDIQWRFAEMKNELFESISDLRGDILGRIENLDDIQQLWGE